MPFHVNYISFRCMFTMVVTTPIVILGGHRAELRSRQCKLTNSITTQSLEQEWRASCAKARSRVPYNNLRFQRTFISLNEQS